MTKDESYLRNLMIADGQPQGATTPRPEPVAWVLWRCWHDGSGDPEVLRVYTDKARADEDFALFGDVSAGRKYQLTEVPWFGL
jgi:hypothetical protein